MQEQKYKPCCGMKCGLAHCRIRDNGGCYCACRLSDQVSALRRVISGENILNPDGSMTHIASREPVPLEGDKLAEIEAILEDIELRLKWYER